MPMPTLSRLAAAVLPLVALFGSSSLAAATAADDPGVRWLQAQLPAGTAIAQADCEQLTLAVGRATRAHRRDAPAILATALTRRGKTDPRRIVTPLPCACVRRIVQASVAAAPSAASVLLEAAVALYPDCADALAAAANDASGTDATDLSTDGAGFGVGFGPGFPGSPGFSGSPPSGALSLPTPAAETPVVNG